MRGKYFQIQGGESTYMVFLKSLGLLKKINNISYIPLPPQQRKYFSPSTIEEGRPTANHNDEAP